MQRFKTNALPDSFQEEHGTTDLNDSDSKPLLPGQGQGQGQHDDGGEDEDLDLEGAGERVWLVKVPKFLMEKWSSVPEEGKILGRVRVYDEKDTTGAPRISVLLDESEAGAGGSEIPTEYKLTLQNTSTKNMFIFGEKEEEVLSSGAPGARKRRRITKLLGTVHHECALTPSLSSLDASSSYRTIMRERQKKASVPKRTVKMLDVDQATANRLASGMGLKGVRARVSTFVKSKPLPGSASNSSSGDLRMARIPRNELLDMLFTLFESAPYWKIKDLTEHVKQPQVFLKEVLGDIANLVPRGPYLGLWTLKDEFKKGGSGGKGKKEEDEKKEGGRLKKEEEALEEEEDEDMEMEAVL